MDYVNKLVSTIPDAEGGVFDLHKNTFNVGMCQMYIKYMSVAKNKESVNEFIQFMKECMTDESCMLVENQTRKQHKSLYWYEIRFGRITASKIYEAVKCKIEGSLSETVLGASGSLVYEAITRGQRLETSVLEEVEKQRKLKSYCVGLLLHQCLVHPQMQ